MARRCSVNSGQMTGHTSAWPVLACDSFWCSVMVSLYRSRCRTLRYRVYKMHYDRLVKKYVEAVKAFQKAKVRYVA